MDEYAKMIEKSVAQNNAWSAEQAQKQMDFQERMSNTAHQREIADLQAAGLNPVLSAKLGGASTPSGAMPDGDTSGTSALIDLLQLSMETANSAAGAARAAASSVEQDTLFGLDPIKNPNKPWQLIYNWAIKNPTNALNTAKSAVQAAKNTIFSRKTTYTAVPINGKKNLNDLRKTFKTSTSGKF